MTFALNAVDVLAGDNRFVEIRKHWPQHRTLSRVDKATQGTYEKFKKEINKASEQLDADQEKMDDALLAEERQIIERGAEQRRRRHADRGQPPGAGVPPGQQDRAGSRRGRGAQPSP